MELWYAWGDEANTLSVPPRVAMLLESALGVTVAARSVAALEDVRLPPSRLGAAEADALAAVVGADWVRTGHEDRVRHTRGKSTPDLLLLRAGDAHDAPDAVVLPGSHDEVLAVLACCSSLGMAVVPFGGGTSVVGGLVAAGTEFAAVISLDLRR